MRRQSRRKQRPRGDDDYEYEDDVNDGDYTEMETGHNNEDEGKVKGKRSGKALKKGRGGGSLVATGGGSDDMSEHYNSAFLDLSKSLTLKPDHENRPIWITSDNKIILEAFSRHYNQAYDFLINIAEPIARPTYFQIYELTPDSLYSAVAVALKPEDIIKYLNRFCKTNVPSEVEKYILDITKTFGRAKLVLKDNNFIVESEHPNVLQHLLRFKDIAEAREDIDDAEEGVTGIAEGDVEFVGFKTSVAPREDRRNVQFEDLGEDDEEDEDEQLLDIKTVSFSVARDLVQSVKKCAKEQANYPLMEEYDFRVDKKNPSLCVDLRPSTSIRPYQVKSLSKMFGNGRARSGIIVLPCGAGKSLTGVVATSTVKKPTVVLCINNASVKQWREQFTKWTTLAEKSIRMFTRDSKEQLPPPTEACVVITTYSMLCHSGKRAADAALMIEAIKGREWGLIVLDEVHVAPADMFRRVLQIVNAHCKLGLTATLVREDDKIPDLSFLVGPKLYEANWIDLTNQGFLARAQCVEVWCPMTKEFYAEYIRCGRQRHTRRQKLLYILNPRKFRVCEHLVKYHAAKGHKIIIFSDDIPALVLYCEQLKSCGLEVPYIYGETKEADRAKWLQLFRVSGEMSCIGLSRVGDTALDLPEANVVVQVSSDFGARRQEAQRLGRILRPKPNPTGDFNAFFYSLVSTDTREAYFSVKRQQYLVDQGYTYKVRQDLADVADRESTALPTKKKEMDLLRMVLDFECDALDSAEDKAVKRSRGGEIDEDEAPGGGSTGRSRGAGGAGGGARGGVRRTVSSLSAVSGASDTVYAEFSQTRS